MPISAQSLIHRCVDTLQDNTSIRWPVDELVRYLNDGQREVILHRPDALTIYIEVDCQPGTRQTLPPNGAKLVEVTRNAVGTRRAVRLVNRTVLDAQTPGWHTHTGTLEILHYMFDPREPRAFYVYPPAAVGARLDVVFSAYPTDIVEPGEGALHTAVTGVVALPDIYGNVLADYVLYRAYLKDSEYAGNMQRAIAHYTAFANALGLEARATVGVGPAIVGAIGANAVAAAGAAGAGAQG